ncbi:hypothetical protein BQ8794_50226 [Mesorhizobium prunaredense]|uniref:Uncharacterized protein n=1 Tax=Mesorhizobium prunaredense TaxID=1631249 RepID=A0A1R3VDX5_9HYPH|nr:hypothetical protein BQ8794_50226 [Mesorhizobium prunaredense]
MGTSSTRNVRLIDLSPTDYAAPQNLTMERQLAFIPLRALPLLDGSDPAHPDKPQRKCES